MLTCAIHPLKSDYPLAVRCPAGFLPQTLDTLPKLICINIQTCYTCRRYRNPQGSAPCHEIAPHLVLMAFLHRVAHAGGTLEREWKKEDR